MDMEKEKTDNIENQTPAPEESPVNPHPEEKERDRKKRKIAEQAEKIREQEEKIKKMTEETERLKEAVADARDQYIRLQAEWDNYRRRTAKERLELIDNAGKDILSGFLPVLDDCQRAMQVLRESDAAAAAVEGTELIYNKLTGYLKQKGVERIEAMGAEFDTDYHEAVAQFPVEDPEKKNKVIDVTQEGYTLNGNVIRYSKVVVGI
jgi:Molecular chaperone GrpE (heat shock protein)